MTLKKEKLNPNIQIPKKTYELCGGFQFQIDAYLDFLAHKIHKPNDNAPMTFITIKSLQGFGKTVTLLEPISNRLNYFIASSNIASNIEDFM